MSTAHNFPAIEEGLAAIEARIPHRPPFLLLDRIVEEDEKRIVCQWRVPEDADWFRGHYPGQPILPGVLLSEHTFQSAACLISKALTGFAEDDGVPVLTKIESARFKRIIRPGETVETTCKVRERLGPAWYMSAQVTCEAQTALKNQFVLSATNAMQRVGA